MSEANYVVHQLFEHLRDTGTLQAIGEQIGEGLARKLGEGNQAARRERIATQAMVALLQHQNNGCETDHACVAFGRNFDAPEMAVGFADRLIAALDKPSPDLLTALKDVVPYAESRAEDMNESVEACAAGGSEPGVVAASALLRDKAWAAVLAAKKLLRENGLVVP